MKWFIETFIKSFPTGKELSITEKQFSIFEKYLKNSKEDGYIYKVYDTINNLKIEAYEWSCIGKHRYYVKIEEV